MFVVVFFNYSFLLFFLFPYFGLVFQGLLLSIYCILFACVCLFALMYLSELTFYIF